MTDSEDKAFEHAIATVEESLQQLKDRYAQVQRDQERQRSLQDQLHQSQREYQQVKIVNQKAALKQEVKNLEAELEEVEIALESQLFSWGSLREPFWQAVRFGGVGVILGWVLKSLASG